MRCSELVEEISHFSFLLARHAHAHVFVDNEALLLHLTALSNKPEMADHPFRTSIDSFLALKLAPEPCVRVIVDAKESINGLLAWLHRPQHGFERLTTGRLEQIVVLRSREFEGRQYLVQFMANSSLKRMSTTSVLVPLEGVLRSVPALSVARLVIPVLPRILLPPPASTTSAPPPLSSRDLVRVRMLLLAQDAVRSASPPPGADAAVPPHDLFGLSPRVWAKEVPHYLPKETYAALAERLNAAARREGLNALAEELARREGRPEHLAGLVVQWSITLRLLAALFAEPWGQFSEVVANPHVVRSRHSDPLIRRPGA